MEAELAANGPQHLELQGVVLNQPEPRVPETSSADEPADAATRVVPRESMHHWPFSRHRAAAKKIAAAKRTSEGKKVAAAGPTLGVASASLVPPSLGSPQLIINTDPPAALVTVDGHALGRSPAIAKGLDPLEVHVVSASLPGFTLIKQNVRFDEGSPVTDVRLVLSRHRDASVASGRTVLVPGSGASARPPEAVDPHPVAEVAPALAAATAALVPTADPQGPVGYLVAATYPVAKVSIDGRDSGRWTPVAPVNPIALSPGSHTVVFETMQGKKQEQRVDIEAGKTSRVIIRQLE